MSKENPHVVIVGSGPIGATYARLLLEGNSQVRVTMLEIGPQLTETPGTSVKNIKDDELRAKARAMSQGPQADEATRARLGLPYLQEGTLTARQGTHLIDFGGPGSGHASSFPMASVASNVGGQGAHWTCAVPRPHGSEKISFYSDAEWEDYLTVAEDLLKVEKNPFKKSKVGNAIRQVLQEEFKDIFTGDVKPNYLPISGIEAEDGTIIWGGTDFVFGPLTDAKSELSSRFELKSLTLGRKILHTDGVVTGVLIEDAVSGKQETLAADLVVVAADAIRSPQLLWASGIRPKALGRYLTEHPVSFCVIALQKEKIGKYATDEDFVAEKRLADLSPSDPISGVSRIPFLEPLHPFSAQVMYVQKPPFPLPDDSPYKDSPYGFVMAGWGGRKFPRVEDGLSFNDDELDYRGFPNVTIDYELTQREIDEMAAAQACQVRAAEVLGEFLPGAGPRLMPPGTSLHYMGTTRIGQDNDGTCVTDRYSQVWEFKNLFVGGNGMIPTANVVNPTLTSVAIAVCGSRRALDLLGS
jgi:pyranose oxidase